MQNMHDQYRKELESIKRLQMQIQETKNSTKSIGSRSDQYEGKVSELEDICCW